MVYIPTDKLSCISNSNVITQGNRQTLVLPSGCLSNTVLRLNCKSSEEEKYYTFDLKNRMLSDDEINSVIMYPNDDTLISKKISYENQVFTVLISGGKTITDIGINFLIKTFSGELLEFTCILPIRPEGVLEKGEHYNVIMGATGPAGKTNFPDNMFIQDGIVIAPDNIGELPDDLVLNGSIYTAPHAYLNGIKTLPKGLYLNSNIVMTDGSVYFLTTINNNGVLCAA